VSAINPQPLLWLGVITLLKKTSLTLLKVLAAMMSVMDLVWFIVVVQFLYLEYISTKKTRRHMRSSRKYLTGAASAIQSHSEHHIEY
jgi:hypothetical protein